MPTLAATGTIAALYVVNDLTLRGRSNFIAINDGVEIRSLEAFGELGGLFVVGASS
jgi:hypothetical protein